jgi:hypothetical protein
MRSPSITPNHAPDGDAEQRRPGRRDLRVTQVTERLLDNWSRTRWGRWPRSSRLTAILKAGSNLSASQSLGIAGRDQQRVAPAMPKGPPHRTFAGARTGWQFVA